MNWANSVLSDLGELPCEGVSSVQEGRLLCQLIDKLSSEAQLIKKVEVRNVLYAKLQRRRVMSWPFMCFKAMLTLMCLTLKAPNKSCSRQHFKFLLLSFEENKA